MKNYKYICPSCNKDIYDHVIGNELDLGIDSFKCPECKQEVVIYTQRTLILADPKLYVFCRLDINQNTVEYLETYSEQDKELVYDALAEKMIDSDGLCYKYFVTIVRKNPVEL